MRYFALASDYDETLAEDSTVDPLTVDALARLAGSGRKLILVTGRTLDDLLAHFKSPHLFARIVAENGAVLYDPETRARKCLADPPPPAFIAELTARGVDPLSIGDVIVATREPHETVVLQAIRDLGMGHQVIFNKGAVMVLPSGVDKGSGLAAALDELGLSRHNVVGIGDAENDHAFLRVCELAVAVQNALPLVQQQADVVTAGRAGRGAVEIANRLISDDLASCEGKLVRHQLLLGHRSTGEDVVLPPYGASVLLIGPSGSGKSQTATALLERVVAHGYQACLIDPEGDYRELGQAVSVGDAEKPPSMDEVLRLLGKPNTHVVVNLLGVGVGDRPAFFSSFLPRLQALRSQTGRPHWIVVDEAHHVLPASLATAPLTLPQSLGSILAVTVHPEKIAAPILRSMRFILAVGARPDETLASFARAAELERPSLDGKALGEGEAFMWDCRSDEPPFVVAVEPAASVLRRHRRKYARGDLGPDNSFYFRGPEGALKLKANNLSTFLSLAEGVDEGTWLFHLHQGDYSRWFRDHIKDEALARRTEEIEQGSLEDSRAAVRAAIEEKYTLPA